MEQFSISLRLGKPSAAHGANLAHNNREFSAANIDPARFDQNIFFTAESITDAYAHLFDEALDAYNAKQSRPVRRIDDYYAHILNGKREEPFYEVIVQFGDSKNSPCGSPRGEIAKEMLIEYMKQFQRRNPNLHIFNAVLHMDEASPHLHIDFIPFYTQGRQRGLSKGVSMKAALNEMGFSSKNKNASAVIGWEEAERLAMEQILRRRGFLREDKQAHYDHMTVEDYKRSQDAARMAELLRRSHKIEPATAAAKMKQQLAEFAARTESLEREKQSPWRVFFYSDAEKLAFVQAQLALRKIPVRETDTGFEAQQCYVDEIRRIEKQYKAPATSIRAQMREDVDQFVMQSQSYEEFLERMQQAKYVIRNGKYLAARPPYGENFIRLKSLGAFYSETALKKRTESNLRWEQKSVEALEESKQMKSPNVVVIQTLHYYISMVRVGKIKVRAKDESKPVSWVNDRELDVLLLLNRKIHFGATLASIQKDFAEKDQAAATLRDQLAESQKDLQTFLELQEKLELLYGEKPSARFTREQAEDTLKLYPSITPHNWIEVYKLVANEKQSVQELQTKLEAAEAELKEAAELAATADRIFGKTFVQDILNRNTYQNSSRFLPNGSFTPDGRYHG